MPTLLPFPHRIQTTGPDAYDALAPAYDALTAGVDHLAALDAVEALARRRELRGRRVLDLACRTGRRVLALYERGYLVTACDGSREMARRAVHRAPGAVVLIADLQALPRLGHHDLTICLDDALNGLLHPDEVRAALAGIARSLDPGGLAVWDVSTLATLRTRFAADWVGDRGEWFIASRGTASPDTGPGSVVEARVDMFRRRGAAWERSSTRLRQRHWPVAELVRLAEEAGLDVLEVDDAGRFVARRDR